MYEEDLNNLEDWLRRLKVEYDIFFNGHRKKPPDDLKMRVERLVKKLSEAGDLSFQQRFRYNTLVARYCVFKDLWRRTLTERESAAEADDQPADRPAGARPEASPKPVVTVVISDPAAETQNVRKLYQSLVQMNKTCQPDSPTVSFERFASYLTRQTEELQKKYDCSCVVFTLAIQDDSVRFMARPYSRRD
ncbi:MAG: hypothetical protein HXY20_05090 [Acidobacteria bacterium]|nr:hypothetical protein [Acidobacteriota bacterium]